MELALTKYDKIKVARKSIELCWWNIELCQLSWVKSIPYPVFISTELNRCHLETAIFPSSMPFPFLHTHEQTLTMATKTLCVLLVCDHIYQVLSNDWSWCFLFELVLLDVTAFAVAASSFLELLLYLSVFMLNLIVFEPMLCMCVCVCDLEWSDD